MKTGRTHGHTVTADSPVKTRCLTEAYLLGATLGLFGAHNFYLGRHNFGVLYFFTVGIFGLGWVYDLYRMGWLVEDANRKTHDPELARKKNILDAYIVWFPLGILGFHHFYMNRPARGFLYLFTCGMFGLGWIADGCRMTALVEKVNCEMSDEPELKNIWATCILARCGLGVVGAHQFYLERTGTGFLYFFTLGLLGCGWIADWFRAPMLMERKNKEIQDGVPDRRKYLDEAYVLWFPFGLLGFHHFYLNRPIWGLLYCHTLGLFGVGWIVDGFRLRRLVREANTARGIPHSDESVLPRLRSTVHPSAPPPYEGGDAVVYPGDEKRLHVHCLTKQGLPSAVYLATFGVVPPSPPPYTQLDDVTASEENRVSVVPIYM